MTTSTTSPRAALVVACFSLFTDLFVYGLAIPVLPLLPDVVAAGPSATGLLFASYAVAVIAVTPVTGRIVDRYGSRTPLLIGLAGLAAALALFAVGGPFWLLLVARAAQGVAAGMAWVASMSLIAAATPAHRRGEAFGVAMSAISVGMLIGPPAAGALVGALGTAAPFLLAAVLALVDGVLRIVLIRDDPRVTDDVAGPAAVLRVPGTAAVATGVAVGALLLAAIEPVLPVELTGRHGTGPVGIGLLFGVAVLTSIVANLVVGRWTATANPRLVLGGGLVVGVVALALIGLGPSLWVVGVGMGLLGIGSAAVLVPATTLIGTQGERAAPPTIGGAYALFNLAYATGMTVGPLLAGPAVDLAGFGPAVLLVAGVTGLVGAAAAAGLPTPGTRR